LEISIAENLFSTLFYPLYGNGYNRNGRNAYDLVNTK